MPLHTAHARNEWHERANERKESPQEDGQVAPLIKKRLTFLHALGCHGLDPARRDDLAPKEVANHKIALVTQDGRHPHDAEQDKDVEATTITAMRKEARGEKQGIAWQKGKEDDARLDKDNEENEAIGDEGPHLDGSFYGRTRVTQQFDDEVDEVHIRSPFLGSGEQDRKRISRCAHAARSMGADARQRPLMAATFRS